MRSGLRILFFISALFTFPHADGAGNIPDAENLGKLFLRLSASTVDTDRLRINDSIKFIIDKFVASDSAFTYKFQGIRYLGQVTARNSQLKIITWNLNLQDQPGRYYCYFIHRSGNQNIVKTLTGSYNLNSPESDKIYSGEDWYGALYYDQRQFKKDGSPYWVLLGIDYGNPSVVRKVIEILSFTPEGKIALGKKLISDGKELKIRTVFEYSSGAVMSLKFLSDKNIVFDHLAPPSASLKEQKESYGPDFSYDSYTLEKGFWKLQTNVDVRNKK